MEIRPYVSFECDPLVDPDEIPPFGKRVASALVESLSKPCAFIDGPEDRDDAWGFLCGWEEMTIDCTLVFVKDGPRQWLLTTKPRISWGDWLRGRNHLEEQKNFLALVNNILKADQRFGSIRWYTRHQWDQESGATWSEVP